MRLMEAGPETTRARSADLAPSRGRRRLRLSQGKRVLIAAPQHTAVRSPRVLPGQRAPRPAAHREAAPSASGTLVSVAPLARHVVPARVSFQPAPDCGPSQVHPQKGVSRPRSGLSTVGPRLLPVPSPGPSKVDDGAVGFLKFCT